MSSIIHGEQKLRNFSNLQMRKALIHYCIKKISPNDCACYGWEEKPRQFKYIFQLDSARFLQTEWHFQIAEAKLHIQIQFTYTNGYDKYLCNITEQRLFVEMQILLKIINLKLNSFLRLSMNTEGAITTYIQKPWSCFEINTKIMLLDFLQMIRDQLRKASVFLIPYLTLSPQRLDSYKIANKKNKEYLEKFRELRENYELLRYQRKKATRIVFQRDQFQYSIQKLAQSLRIVSEALRQQAGIINKYIISQRQYIQNVLSQKDKLKSGLFNELTPQPILLGLTIDVVFDEKPFITSGALSNIQINKYKYSIMFTTSELYSKQKIGMSYPTNSEDNTAIIRVQVGFLAKKTPKQKLQAKNSYFNQLTCLQYAKTVGNCFYVANYYLESYSKQLFIKFYDMGLDTLLFKIRQNHYSLSLLQKITLLYKIVEGVRYLSVIKVCHRDLKPSNIMITKDNTPKIIDFGSVCPVYGFNSFSVCCKQLLSTEAYFSKYQKCDKSVKELYQEDQYNEHIYFDCYSLGKIIEDFFFKNQSNCSECLASHFYEMIKYIKDKCIDENPSDRLSSQQIQLILQICFEYLKNTYHNANLSEN